MADDNNSTKNNVDLISNAALNAVEKEQLERSFEDKLHILDEKQVDVLEGLTPNVRKRVEVLRDFQSQHDELEARYFEERATLEDKYQKLYDPLYTKRYEIISGVVEVEGTTNETKKDASTENKSSEEVGVPNFWLTAMKNNFLLAGEIQECDEEALKFLKDVKWCKLNDPKSFKLEFFFDPNPYFKNSVLTKTYHMADESEPILEKAVGTGIQWHPGKCLTQKILEKKPKKGSKNSIPITKTERCSSFFNFFSPPQIPEDDDEIDEDIVDHLQDQMEGDYDIGLIIRNKIIPHAVSWFTGEAAEDNELLASDEEDMDDEYEE